MCSICGIVSVPAGSRGSGSEPGRRSHAGRDAAGWFGPDRRQAAVGATAAASAPAFSSPRLLTPPESGV